MLAQELDDPVNTIVLSAANHRAPGFFLRHKASSNQPAQVEGQRGGRDVETGLNISDVKPRRSRPNQEPIDVQSGQIAQFGQAARR